MRTRRFFVFLASLAMVVLWAVAQAPPIPGSEVDQALAQIRPEAIRAHIRFLAHDLLEGRGTGTRGYQLAAHYVAAQFEALGLEPAGSEGSYFQPVPLRKTEVVEEQCSLVLAGEGEEVKLAYGEEYLMAGDPLRTETSVAAPVVFVGFGVTAPELDYDDYAGVDARGKIVAQFMGAPPSFPHNQRAYYSSGTVKKQNAAAHGAVGILSFMTGEAAKRYRWKWIVRQVRLGGMRWLDSEGAPHPEAPPDIRGTAFLSPAGVEALFAAAPESLQELFTAARAGKPLAFELPVQVRIRTVSRHTSIKSPNVAAVLPGSDPQLREEYVVYTAHLDHLGVGEPVAGDAIYNGAYDNAAGTATLLEAARAFASLRQPLPQS